MTQNETTATKMTTEVFFNKLCNSGFKSMEGNGDKTYIQMKIECMDFNGNSLDVIGKGESCAYCIDIIEDELKYEFSDNDDRCSFSTGDMSYDFS